MAIVVQQAQLHDRYGEFQQAVEGDEGRQVDVLLEERQQGEYFPDFQLPTELLQVVYPE